MDFEPLLKTTYTNDNRIIKTDTDIQLHILETIDSKVILHLTVEDAKKLLTSNTEFAEQFKQISNEAFKKEIGFIDDSTYDRIMKYDKQTELDDMERIDWMILTYDLKENQFIGSLFYGDKFVQTIDNMIMSVYVYGLFSNPKYHRQGHCQKMLNYLMDMKVQTYNIYVIISTIYSWNLPSINLFKKLGFTIQNVDLDSKVDDYKKKNNIDELECVCEYEGQQLNEAHYFTMMKCFYG